MSAFREAIAKEVRKELMNPEFDARRSKNGGRVFWVKASTATGFGQFVKEHPQYDDNVAAVHTTMSSAAAAVVADRGDEVRVTEGHTEEFEKAFCLSTSGVRWVGEGYGTKVPVLTVSGGVHGVAIEAAGVEFDNFRFAAPPVTARSLSMIRMKAAGCKVANIVGQGAAAGTAREFVDCIRIVSGADDFVLENIKLYGGSNGLGGPDSFLNFENSTSRGSILKFVGIGSVGVAGIRDASDAYTRHAHLKDIRVAVMGPSRAAVTLDTGTEGTDINSIVENGYFAGTNTTLATNAVFTGGWRLFEVKVLEEMGSKAQGALIPAVDTD